MPAGLLAEATPTPGALGLSGIGTAPVIPPAVDNGARVTCKVGGPKRKRRLACTLKYKTKRTKVTWRLALGKRTIAKGDAKPRRGRAAIKVAPKRGLKKGRYKLTVTVSGGGTKAVKATRTVRIR